MTTCLTIILAVSTGRFRQETLNNPWRHQKVVQWFRQLGEKL